jgi:polyisoprenoid-binding protein YceI
MKRFLIAAALTALFVSPVIGREPTNTPPAEAPATADAPAPAPPPPPPPAADLPAGSYTLDKYHSTLIFRVSHLGFSNYTASFSKFDAKLELDPANPGTAKLEATVDPASLTLVNPPEGFLQELLGANWLNAAQFPQMTFRSTAVEVTSPNTARVTGDFTFHGATKPVVLETTFNGGYPGHPLDPHARIGFSAKGSFLRSEFGMANGVPAPGTTMGVSDSVEFIIETEFNGPPLKQAAPVQ